jgi:excisionase family DNA binding protein
MSKVLIGDPTAYSAVHLLPPSQRPTYQPHQLLTIAQTCHEYGIGKTMLYQALADRQLTAKVVGKRGTRIRREDIDRWIASLPDYKPQNQRSG